MGNQTFGETLINSISFKNHINIQMITQFFSLWHTDAIIYAGWKEDLLDIQIPINIKTLVCSLGTYSGVCRLNKITAVQVDCWLWVNVTNFHFICLERSSASDKKKKKRMAASILKADIWPRFRFYESTSKKELLKTHVVCKICTTTNTIHHVIRFHS